MKLRNFVCGCVLLGMLAGLVGTAGADTWDTVKEAYVFCFPLVLMDATKTVGTNTVEATANKAPENQFLHAQALATAKFRQVVTPNVDTLYSQLFLNLSDDAVVIEKPAADRFLSLEVMDAWSNCVTVLGTGGKDDTEGKRTYLLTGPNFTGTVPENMKRVEMPTAIGWILGRTVCSGDSDLENVYAIQKELTSKTLDVYNTPGKTMPKGKYDAANEFTPIKHAQEMSAKEFFGKVNELLKVNPPSPTDDEKLAKLKTINVGAGLTFDESILADADGAKWKEMTGSIRNELLASVKKDGYAKQMGVFNFFGEPIAEFGKAYNYRGLVAIDAFGANPTYIAIYPSANIDDEGDKLNAQNAYVLHFDKVPPVKTHGFWSVTAYGDDNFLIDNELNRYCINDRSGAKVNDDGSLDIYLQSTKPSDAAKVSNWLPVGTAGFHLHLRIYLPEDSTLDGTWIWPTIKKAGGGGEVPAKSEVNADALSRLFGGAKVYTDLPAESEDRTGNAANEARSEMASSITSAFAAENLEVSGDIAYIPMRVLSIDQAGIYVFGIKDLLVKNNIKAGYRLFGFVTNGSGKVKTSSINVNLAEAAAPGTNEVVFVENIASPTRTIEVVPQGQDVAAAANLEKGQAYVTIAGADLKTGGVTSSKGSGGCDAGLGISGLILLTLSAFCLKKYR